MSREPLRVGLAMVGTIVLLVGCGGPTGSQAPTGTSPATSTATAAASVVESVPAGSPLTLVWKTAGPAAAPMVDPIHLALSPDGHIYVGTSTSTGLFQIFDSDGNFVSSWGEKGASEGQILFLLGLGVDSKGNVYGADFNRSLINKYDKTGKFLTSWSTEPPTGPGGMAIDAQDNIYIVNHRTHEHQVQKFSSDGTLLISFGLNGSGEGEIGAAARGGPEDLAVDSAGNVYVADKDNNRIQKYSSDGTFLATIGTAGLDGNGELSGPWDITVDGLGNIYVLSDAFLQKFDAAGLFVTEWPLTGPLELAGDVLAGPDGTLYLNTDGDPILEKLTQ